MLESKRHIPSTIIEPKPNPEIKPYKIRPHPHTYMLRKKF
jgi:hypothetical protein